MNRTGFVEGLMRQRMVHVRERARVRVAAYQAPLHATTSDGILGLIREQVEVCAAQGVEILCCPEAVLGGLADYASRPLDIALAGQLQARLAPLASDRVAVVLGFTELRNGRLFNAAAVFHKGSIAGIYRKMHPAIHTSIYDPGDATAVFTVGELTFGIIICRDSTYREPARTMASRGATMLFVPTNNGLPIGKAGPELVAESRDCDIALARENGVFVVRADVAGQTENLLSYGASAIVDPDGRVLQSARPLSADLIVAEIMTGARSG